MDIYQNLDFLKPRVLVGLISEIHLTDIEFANYCVVVVLTDGVKAKYLHFRTNHSFDEVINTISKETIGCDFNPNLNFLYGSNDDYQESTNLVGKVKQAMSMLHFSINFEDIGGQFDRRGYLNNQEFKVIRQSFIGNKHDSVNYVFNEQ
ncbi:MAG: hypothetical protein ACMG57_00035 [Candidatus Dojkabacteria bacterium]